MIYINTCYTGWWFQTFSVFPYIGNFIIPTDELIFFRGVAQPPTSIICYDFVTPRPEATHGLPDDAFRILPMPPPISGAS